MNKLLFTIMTLLCLTVVAPVATWANNNEETVATVQEKATKSTATEYPQTKYCNGNNVNIRREPTLDSEIIDQAFVNTTFEVIDEKDGWSKIKGEDDDCGTYGYSGFAYIKSEYLSDGEIPNLLDGYEKVSSYDYIATAYDLSVQSCGKRIGSKGYGVTCSGTSIANKSHDEAMCIAVDRRLIPLHTKVYVEFKEEAYQKYNGIYTALDTGSGVKGKHIDVFMGDYQQYKPHEDTLEFGVRDCTITVLKDKVKEN